MESISLFDETLDINLTLTYHLCMQIGQDGLSYCILDSVRDRFIAFCHKEFVKPETSADLLKQIKDTIQKDELLLKEFKSVRLVYLSRRALMVPDPLFNQESMSELFYFSFSKNDQEALQYNKLNHIDAVNLFGIPMDIATELISYFPNVKFYQQATPMIENLILSHKNKAGLQRVFVNVGADFFDIAVIDSGKLVLYNTFNFKNENDFIYFIMYIFEQLNLNTEKTEIFFSGSISKDDALHQITRRFVKNVKFERPSENYTYSYTYNDLPTHLFVNMINSSMCE